ncbi:ogr/Delta-like zinc finger family protein [Vibrio fluvialis]|nr:ogr/Delta-like zinc finger family protein [Vibrio fluvialis]
MKPQINCPKCGGHTRVATSKAMSLSAREAYMQCVNPDCGTALICLVYPNRVIRKSNDISPPDQTIQPKLYQQMEQLINRINKPTELR